MSGIFDNLIDKEKKLIEQISGCPKVEITGLVGANGVGAAKLGREQLWSMTMTFDAWRIGSGKLRTDSLTVRCKVSDEELKAYQNNINKESVIKILASESDDNIFQRPQALLYDVREHNTFDIELQTYLEKLKIPIVYKDKRFGEFTFDRKVNWYTAKTKWIGKNISLNLSVEQTDGFEKAIKCAETLWADQKTWNQRICEYAIEKLLSLKNSSWLEEDEKEISEKDFKKRMKLESITIYTDGSFEFWHDDGDLFWGHSILISGTLVDGPTDADIPG